MIDRCWLIHAISTSFGYGMNDVMPKKKIIRDQEYSLEWLYNVKPQESVFGVITKRFFFKDLKLSFIDRKCPQHINRGYRIIEY